MGDRGARGVMAQHTALYDRHRGLGARVVDFAGWDMPVSYRGALDEHRAVRERCGLFDVSHMGEVEVRGRDAAAWCDRLTVNDVTRLQDGEAQYSVLCDERGGVIDDLIVSRLAADRFLLVVNASNAPIDLGWMREHASPGVELVDRSAETGLLALQGPRAVAVLSRLGATDLESMRPFTVRRATIAGQAVLLSRTGYTGEDGFELFVGTTDVVALWDALLEAMRVDEGLPCGLAARDSLRLEAALPLHGSDMDRTTTPLEAGLGWVVKLGKPDFVGKAALAAQQERGLERRLVGLEMDEAGVPRHAQAVFAGGTRIGEVTSGTKSPTLDRFIAMAYVAAGHAQPGTSLHVDVRGRQHAAHVVQRPFYRRAR
jgi:glycine cleavage system T protein (aminomethyltransferase)